MGIYVGVRLYVVWKPPYNLLVFSSDSVRVTTRYFDSMENLKTCILKKNVLVPMRIKVNLLMGKVHWLQLLSVAN